jgi:DNA repair ATPase RecN
MAKLYLDELEAALSFQGLKNLTTDVSDSEKMISTLDEFISTSGEYLSGEPWDSVRTKVETYKKAMESRKKIAGELHSSIEEGLKLLISYMGEYQMLDSAQLNDCLNKKAECEKTISSLRSRLNNSADSSSIRNQIATAESILEDLKKIIEKLEGLDAECSKALGIFESGNAGVSAFSSEAQIQSSGKYVYNQ